MLPLPGPPQGTAMISNVIRSSHAQPLPIFPPTSNFCSKCTRTGGATVDTCGHNIQINAFYISSCALARVEPSRKGDACPKLKARQRKATKPAPCALSPQQACRLKVVRLLPMSSDAGSHTWVTCGASDSFAFQPTGGSDAGEIKDLKLSMVLCEFAVRAVVSEWPVLQLRLSRSVEAVMTGFQETYINPAS